MSQSACWGTNKLEKCAWISFGYGSCYDTDRFWVSLEAAKALARFDYEHQADYDWHYKIEEYKTLSPRARLHYSNWHIHIPGSNGSEEVEWWIELEKELGKYKSPEGIHGSEYQKWRLENHPEDAAIVDRCHMMSRRADEARHGFQDICHDETELNICTENHRYPNGGGNFREDFIYKEEVLLTDNDDVNALIIAKVIMQNHYKMYFNMWSLGANEEKVVPTLDWNNIDIFAHENECGWYVDKIKIEGAVFTFDIMGGGSLFRYNFDKEKDCKPDLEDIARREEEIREDRAPKKLQPMTMLEWGQTWDEMAMHPKCLYEYNKNFNSNIFDPEMYTPRKNFGYYRFSNPEATEQGDWYIFGGPLRIKQFVQSIGDENIYGLSTERLYIEYNCQPLDWFIFGGYRKDAPDYRYSRHGQHWNPELL